MANTYLTKTFASVRNINTNRNFSAWVKRSRLTGAVINLTAGQAS